MKGLAEQIAGREAAEEARERFLSRLAEEGEVRRGVIVDEAADLAATLACTYPALAREIDARPRDVLALGRGTKQARDARAYRRSALAVIGELTDPEKVRRGLRTLARREKLRIAARELLLHAGSDVDVTARELSDLADVCTDLALGEALAWADARFGIPTAHDGARCPFVVVGMGKLGGRELNAGSDVDLLLFYETDEGEVIKDGAPSELTLHEYFTRVSQRFVSTLDDVTEDGAVWRVDLRLRPEGSKGPLVNALAAAERYYETWGRTWERVALLRARPMAGDLAFGARMIDALSPFVWRRAVDPRVADEITALLHRARVEAGGDVSRDLKIGPGGIREVEFFAQSLQLVWGGRERVVRSQNTLDALRRLRARGFVTDREGREMADAYMTLRRLEHRVQFASGVQTHAIPDDPGVLLRIARSLGFADAAALMDDLGGIRRGVTARFASLARPDAPRADDSQIGFAVERLLVALDGGDEEAVLQWLARRAPGVAPDAARHLFSLARRPDAPLGAVTLDRHPELAGVLIEALFESADPEQATRLMGAFFARFVTPGIYARALAEDPYLVRKVASLFGASRFLGESLVGHPELLDGLLFVRGKPSPERASAALAEELKSIPADDAEAFVGGLRRAKARITMEVGLANLAGELTTREAMLVLSAMADATLDAATTWALRERGLHAGLSVVAMGKLGGREIGYGSDLDLFFVYEGNDEDAERHVRAAQRVIRLVTTAHDEGAGYELDTRLRPSGNQGLLVVSREGFARYQATSAEDWERQALLKARPCAGDRALGAYVASIATAAAYERGAPPPERLHHVRARMERELARERPGRYDLKLGKGGLADVEFAVQWLQMKHGADPRVRTPETDSGLNALEACGYIEAGVADALREGYRFLRRLQQRLRVMHGTSAHLIEDGAPGLVPLARRMGMRDGPRGTASAALLARYAEVTRDVRAAYLSVLGIPEPPP